MSQTVSLEYVERLMRKFQAAFESGEIGPAEATDFQAVLTHESNCSVYSGGVSLFGGSGRTFPMTGSAECQCDFALSVQFTTARS